MSQGAAGNPTVAMIQAAFTHHQLPWRYINLEVAPADLPAAVHGALAMGFRGFNLSMPHKVAVIPLLAGLGESAKLIGAVNCVVRRDGAFVGENTDGKGFLTSLQTVIDPRGTNVVLFGAGGAARAIAIELALAGIRHLTIVNRAMDRGRGLVDALRAGTPTEVTFVPWSGNYVVPSDTQVLINATSIGLYAPEARVPVAVESLRPEMVVADVVFNPPNTRFLDEAAARGCTTLDGLGMLVNQGVIGVSYWTGVTPDAAVMRRALEQALGLAR
ncbi:shikimate 5-dehydrogenase [Opitutus terrae PB90-1]|uniref:shikimate dehydrogenase (NADP(+)) n=2 Tax=Opitutus terrae TaxID=107709 RepID=B1ZZ98_OPITP|nr:shikimate 5-dehydrogenase [Opitutus terrae PB90-1]